MHLLGAPFASTNAKSAVFDGLELHTRCNETPPLLLSHDGFPVSAPLLSNSGNVTVYVDYAEGSDKNSGSENSPMKTIMAAVAKTRKADVTPKFVVLRGGVHYLDGKTVALDARDSGLTIMAHTTGNGDVEHPWVSGAVPLTTTWTPFNTSAWRNSTDEERMNVYVADLSSQPAAVAAMHASKGLRLKGKRAVAARYPNADYETDFFPTGYIKKASSWLSPQKFPKTAKQVTISSPSRMNISNSWTEYKLGIGGADSISAQPQATRHDHPIIQC
jgi:hypothetical protein